MKFQPLLLLLTTWFMLAAASLAGRFFFLQQESGTVGRARCGVVDPTVPVRSQSKDDLERKLNVEGLARTYARRSVVVADGVIELAKPVQSVGCRPANT